MSANFGLYKTIDNHATIEVQCSIWCLMLSLLQYIKAQKEEV